MVTQNDLTRCDRLALLVDQAHRLISAGRIGRGLGLLLFVADYRQRTQRSAAKKAGWGA